MSPRRRGPRQPYAVAVPSVWRAIRVVEQLRGQADGATLAELSRSLDLSPSSLLAILRTLERAGWLARDPVTRRYRLGPALAYRGARPWSTELLALARDLRAAADRLEAAIGPSAVAPSRSSANSEAEPALLAGPLEAAELDAFLAGPWLATLAWVKEDGYPCSVPVWYEWSGGRFWIIARGRASWADRVQRAGRVSLSISETSPPFRRVLAEGRIDAVDQPEPSFLLALQDRMLRRYLGTEQPVDGALAPRRLFHIAPERLVAWRGLVALPSAADAHRAAQRSGGSASPTGTASAADGPPASRRRR